MVASPWLLKASGTPQTPAEMARFTLIEAGDAHRTANLEWLTWRRWFDTQGCGQLQPKRWLYFNYAHQIVQAALAGQGLALSSVPRSSQRPEIQAFCAWLALEAENTRRAIGDMPDPDTLASPY